MCVLGSRHPRLNVDSGFFFFQAEDGIRDLVRSRGLGDVYKRQLFAIVDDQTQPLGVRLDGDLPEDAEIVLAGRFERLSLIHI